jgi:hypothetical protein
MIELKKTPEHIELVKAMGSRNKQVSMEAAEAFAAGIWPVIQQVLQQAGTVSLIYNDYEFDEDTAPIIPLDFLYGQGANVVTTWSAGINGGLPTSEMYSSDELRVSYYDIDSAVSFRKQFARKSLLPILSNSVERMINEILVKQELQGWSVIMAGLAQASTNVNGTQYTHTIPAGTQGIFLLNDFSNLITRGRRINHSYAQGTPVTPYSKGITDLFVSPEVKAQIRAFAFNPMNAKGAGGATLGSSDYRSNGIPLPDAIREEIYRSAGTSSLFDVNITDLNEFGVGAKYNTLFGVYANGNIAPGNTSFVAGTNEVLVGIDLTKKAFVRGVQSANQNPGDGATVSVMVDDQFTLRQDKIGFWAGVREGRVLADARSTVGLII